MKQGVMCAMFHYEHLYWFQTTDDVGYRTK